MSKLNRFRSQGLIVLMVLILTPTIALSTPISRTHGTLRKHAGVGSWGFDTGEQCVSLGIKVCGRAALEFGGDLFIVEEDGRIKLETSDETMWFDGTTGLLKQNFGIAFGTSAKLVVFGNDYPISIPYIGWRDFILRDSIGFAPYSLSRTQTLQASIPRQELICVGVDYSLIKGLLCLEGDAGNRFEFTGNRVNTSKGTITYDGQRKNVSLNCSQSTFSVSSVDKDWGFSGTISVSLYFTGKVKIGFIEYELPITIIEDYPLPISNLVPWLSSSFSTDPISPVNFPLPCYTLSLSKQGCCSEVRVDGSRKSLPWSGKYLDGEYVSLSAVEDNCCKFVRWSGSISGTNPSTSVRMTGNKSVTVVCESRGIDSPNITGLPPRVCGGETHTLYANSSDAIDFSWSSSCGGQFSNRSGSQPSWTVPLDYSGACEITVDVSNKCGVDSDRAPTTVKQKPGTPGTPSVLPDPVCVNTQYCISWGLVSGADSYEISENDSSFSNVGNTTSKCYTKSTSGSYSYRVRARNTCGVSDASGGSAVTIEQCYAVKGYLVDSNDSVWANQALTLRPRSSSTSAPSSGSGQIYYDTTNTNGLFEFQDVFKDKYCVEVDKDTALVKCLYPIAESSFDQGAVEDSNYNISYSGGLYTSVSEDDPPELPRGFTLRQNTPNPFNPVTKIALELPKRSAWQITIFNIKGEVVETFKGNSPAGVVEVEWDASGVASGVYFYRAVAEGFSSTRKMILLK